MFPTKRYVTARIHDEVSLTVEAFMWSCIDTMPGEVDYLQIFELSEDNGWQRIIHMQEVPAYHREYWIPCDKPLIAKIFVIDDSEHATMLFAEEY